MFRLFKLYNKINSLQSENKRLTEKLSTTQSRLVEAQNKNDKLNKEIVRLLYKHNELYDEMNNVNECVDEFLDKLDRLK